MRTKSLATFALAGTLAFAPLVGCMDQTATDDTATNTTEQVETTEPTDSMSGEDTTVVDGDGQLQGGWTVNTDVTTSLTDEEQAIFDQAAAEYDGVELEGIAVLATKQGTGTDYAYLCKAVTTTENSAISWAIALVNDDENGASSITSVEGIELDEIEVGSEEQQVSDLMGDWELQSLDAAAELPGEAAQAFETATDGYVGMSLTPMVLLGTLDASGTNYLVLCQGTTTTAEDPQQALCVAHVYEDSAGNAEFADVAQLDLLAYV